MNKNGFTLIELTLTIAIILLMATIPIVNLVKVRHESEIAKVLQELKNINTAITMYELIELKSPKIWDDLSPYIDISKLKDKYELNLN